MNKSTAISLIENIRRVFKKMHRELEPGSEEHSTLIDLVNHGDTLAQQAELVCRNSNGIMDDMEGEE